MKEIKLTRHQVKVLLYWAEYGVSKAKSGSYEDILTLIPKLSVKAKFRGIKKIIKFGDRLK